MKLHININDVDYDAYINDIPTTEIDGIRLVTENNIFDVSNGVVNIRSNNVNNKFIKLYLNINGSWLFYSKFFYCNKGNEINYNNIENEFFNKIGGVVKWMKEN